MPKSLRRSRPIIISYRDKCPLWTCTVLFTLADGDSSGSVNVTWTTLTFFWRLCSTSRARWQSQIESCEGGALQQPTSCGELQWPGRRRLPSEDTPEVRLKQEELLAGALLEVLDMDVIPWRIRVTRVVSELHQSICSLLELATLGSLKGNGGKIDCGCSSSRRPSCMGATFMLYLLECCFLKSRVKVEGNFVQMFPVCKDAKEVFEVAFAWCSLVLRED